LKIANEAYETNREAVPNCIAQHNGDRQKEPPRRDTNRRSSWPQVTSQIAFRLRFPRADKVLLKTHQKIDIASRGAV